MTSRLGFAVAFVLAVAVALFAAPVAAHAAPAPRPTAVTVAGNGIEGKLTVTQQERSDVFQALLNEVGWLATATPQTSKPDAAKLGPRYVVTVLVKNAPQQVYELYPLAAGGPRAHRPAKQPTGKKADGWFYGRLSMSESLRVAGVPLETKSRVVNGGIGGGIGEEVTVDEAAPLPAVEDLLGQMRQLVLLNGAVLVVILLGLGGISYVIRRRV